MAKDLGRTEFLAMGVTTAVSLTTNMGIAFTAGLAACYLRSGFWDTQIDSGLFGFLLPPVQPEINYSPNPENDGAIGGPTTEGIVSQRGNLASPQ